ncbi:tyrosine-type recombinase/integrase [Cupriavidus sp. KK10]|jgi:integrase|uniref:tyrosine-type recombinase/integrase n=1 Tax=Cupriavidus sp. KK10 TaxID=1478019 RepID=UPI001BA83AE6|nr:tyrosine-type recombinase/integrase [Cupriavidus sp. KK10]QUN30612.1 tyrosine-type recombinase/integrase [Cupriavidus sp. KK10]
MLTPAIDAYLAIRRSAGFGLRVAEGFLRNYARFATARGETHVREQTALEWAALAPSVSQRGRRLEAIRIFARHAQAEDTRHEVPRRNVFPRQRMLYRPFIFTAVQIRQLLEQAARLPPSDSLRPWTYCTLFSLLAVTGLRISEALALRFEDITADGLVIRASKFHKSRLVPLHPSAQAGLERYLERRRQLGGGDDHVFISSRRRGLHYSAVQETFRTLVQEIGLGPDPGRPGPRPRIHDLRHSWAVRALENCPPGYDYVRQHVLAVSTYLGHAKLTGTFVYLHTTPHLLSDIANRCEDFFKGATS